MPRKTRALLVANPQAVLKAKRAAQLRAMLLQLLPRKLALQPLLKRKRRATIFKPLKPASLKTNGLVAPSQRRKTPKSLLPWQKHPTQRRTRGRLLGTSSQAGSLPRFARLGQQLLLVRLLQAAK